MHAPLLTLRYLTKRRIALCAVAAVALCVALLIVVTSLFTGFIDAYERHGRQLLGELALQPRQPLASWQNLANELEALPQIRRAQPVIESGALLYLTRGDVRGVTLSGLNLTKQLQDPLFQKGLILPSPSGRRWPEGPGTGSSDRTSASLTLSPHAQETARQWLRQRLRREPRPDEMPVPAVIGIGVLAQPDEKTDRYDLAEIADRLAQWSEPMVLTTARQNARLTEDGDMTDARVRRTCWPVAAVQTGLHLTDSSYIYLPLDAVADMIGQPTPDDPQPRCTGLVRMDLADNSPRLDAAQAAWNVWKTFAQTHLNLPAVTPASADLFAPLDQPNVRVFTHEIQKQLRIMQLLLGLICGVAALLVFIILFMIVNEKRRDIGILRSVGASRLSICLVFLGYGLAIGIVGAAGGIALGAAATRNIAAIEQLLASLLGFKIWRAGVYMFSDIPNQVAWASVVWIVAAGIAAAVLGALLPAVRAARWNPVDALRWE